MRKQLKWIILAVLILLLLSVLAMGDDLGSDDPLISLSYLTGTYETKLKESFEQTLKTHEDSVAERWEKYGLDAPAAAPTSAAVTTHTAATIPIGSSYVVPEGAEFLMEQGQLNAAVSGLVDTTLGTEVPASGALTVYHLYVASSAVNLMASEDSVILIRK